MKRHWFFALILTVGVPGCSGKGSRPEHLGGLTAYAAQLHLHGLTNHNASEKPASMQWHSYFAAQSGIDVIWWTDHHHGFDLRKDYAMNLELGKMDQETLEVRGLSSFRRYLTRLTAVVTGGAAEANLKRGRLTMKLRSDPQEHFQRFLYWPRSELGKVRLTSWARPVSSGLEFRGTMEVRAIDGNGAIEIEAHLSWHVREAAHQDTLLFRFLVSRDSVLARTVSSHFTLVELPLPENWQEGKAVPFAVDLLRAAELLEWGDDNTLSEIAFGVAARDGAGVEVTFSNLRLHSRDPGAEHQISEIARLSRRYQEEYGVVQHVGIEFGGLHDLDRPHMDAHFPGAVPEFGTLCRLYREDLAGWVAAVHDARGIVTVNHIFGAAGRRRTARTRAEVQETVLKVAREVLDHEAYRGDLFEAGYLARAGAVLEDYLQVWDILLANGHRIYGDATTDCHGGEWGLDMTPNPLITWIWAADSSRESLLDAMRTGRLFFGNPFLWRGELSIWTEGVWMGDEMIVEKPETDLHVFLAPRPRQAQAFLVQVRMGNGVDVEYIHDRTPLDPTRAIALDTSQPSFARVEIYEEVSPDSLTPLVFSNPIFLIPEGGPRPDAEKTLESLKVPYVRGE